MKVLAVCEEDSPYTDRLILLIAGDCVLHPVFTAYRAGEHCTGKQNLGEKKKKKSIYQHESMIFVGKRSNMPAVTIAWTQTVIEFYVTSRLDFRVAIFIPKIFHSFNVWLLWLYFVWIKLDKNLLALDDKSK